MFPIYVPYCFGFSILIHISIYSKIQIHILQYNHDRIQKKSHVTSTNLFPFEQNGAQFETMSQINKIMTALLC